MDQTMIQCCINTIIIKIAHGRDQLVYYDTWVGQLQRKPHEAASTCWNNAVDKFAMHTYQSIFKIK